jgi:hypothetical protein
MIYLDEILPLSPSYAAWPDSSTRVRVRHTAAARQGIRETINNPFDTVARQVR